MISKEFFRNLDMVAEEKRLTLEQVMEATKKAMIKAYQKVYGNASARVVFKPEKSEILLYAQQLVVEEIQEIVREKGDKEQDMEQITLEDAKKISRRYKLGDIVETAINPKDFGRLATSTGKQVFNQTIKTSEKDNVYETFKAQENEMITAEVIAIGDQFVTLNVGHRTTTLLPNKEILSNDHFSIGDRIKVYLTSVEPGTKSPKIYVSRSDKNLVTRLMELSIPEIAEGIIEIRGIARDAGDRTKIAIFSNDPHVDAIGSCVGEGGNRIKEVVSALNGEKIDLYRYSSIPEELIANSLQPASVEAVLDVDQKTKTSLAIVPDDQLSLAIGKQGQNVRLAVQSCGWKIDIKSASDARSEGISF